MKHGFSLTKPQKDFEKATQESALVEFSELAYINKKLNGIKIACSGFITHASHITQNP